MRWAPILIGWVSLGKPSGPQDGFAAVGGPAAAVPDGRVWVLTSGAVQISTDVNLTADDLKGLVMHQLGHVLGLAHTTQPDEVMNPSGATSRTVWGSGDLAGLAKVGRAAGCLPEATAQFS